MPGTFILFFLVLSPLTATAKPRPQWRSARQRATPWTLRQVCFIVPTNKLQKPPSQPVSPLPSQPPQARQRLSRVPPLFRRRRHHHNCRANLSSSSPPPHPHPSCPPHLHLLRNPPPYVCKASQSLWSQHSAPKTDLQHQQRHRLSPG